jgi:hypothetical protein
MLSYTRILLKTAKTTTLIDVLYNFIHRRTHPDPSRCYSAKRTSIILRNELNGGLTSQIILKT